MEYFIDGKSASERTFWGCVNVLGNMTQKKLLLDGFKVKIAEKTYWIEPKKYNTYYPKEV
ncbi:MAG: hypothetical protein Q4C49_13680 [Bacillota bacterium]|nr:hypothetical protein [Bacillota bacterium]